MNQKEVNCPYCGESQIIEVLLEGGTSQKYTEDCQVCCRPWLVTIFISEEGDTDVRIERELE